MRTPYLVLCALVLSPLLRADRFWLEPKADQSDVEGSVPAVIEGVLLEETDGVYRIRVVGGEIELAKSGVHAVDKDGLTVAAIEQAEGDQREQLAQAEQERVEAMRMAREAEMVRREVQASEAAANAAAVPVEAGFAPVVAPVVYDPVVGAGVPVGLSDAELMRELEAAYRVTGDRAYLKQLRQLRRLR